jgi:signal transduction histidine kinase
MRWQPFAVYILFFAVWGVFAAWQYRGWEHEGQLIDGTLHQQSHSVMNALLGGVRSHRRLGRYFETQLQGMLEELVKSEDVFAVAILSPNGDAILGTGEVGMLDEGPPIEPGDQWTPGGFRLVEPFTLPPPEAGPEARGEVWGGRGRGMGVRGGYEPIEEDSPFADGGTFYAVLLLDRAPADHLKERSVRSHGFVTAAAALGLLCMALAWRTNVRLVEARGREKILETEARHLRELSQAAAGLAHETRNPLGLIRGWTQRLAQQAATTPDQQDHAQAVIEECDRVTARINQFLAFARPCDPAISAVEPQKIADELTVILQPDLEAKDLRLACEISPAIRQVQADRELLRQALFNLVQNAIQFAPAGDTVTINFREDGADRCRIDVADHGPGVAAEAVESLFTPYFTTRSDGTGLGLAIVRRIATAHGWRVDYRPGAETGSVFTLHGIHV